MDNNVYINNGYRNRQEYLESLADDYGIDIEIVAEFADILGPDEDFDGLVSEMETYDNYFMLVEENGEEI